LILLSPPSHALSATLPSLPYAKLPFESVLNLHQIVADAFGPQGALAQADARYVEREVQQRVALGVARAIEQRRVLVAEAGTGVGKTFAYLVPTLLSGKRALISTATKGLQDQLFLRDLPRLRAALKLPVTLALLKGRGSYLCLYRMAQARQSGAALDRWALRTLAKVEQWAQSTVQGDLAEIEDLDERSSVIPLVTSARENCLGSECPQHRQCHVMLARREAMAADVVVVNHHLFFADMALRDTGVAELLPSVEVAVFDEAHQLAEAGVQFLGMGLSSGQLMDFARDVVAAGVQHARGLGEWQSLGARGEAVARELRLAAAGHLADAGLKTGKVAWELLAVQTPFTDALHAVVQVCGELKAALWTVVDAAPEFVKLADRAAELAAQAQQLIAPVSMGRVRWVDVSAHQVRLVDSPLDVREALRAQIEAAPKTWIFTSATLGDDEQLTWFTESAGLGDADTLRVGSPFDYANHAKLYVPQRFPRPSEPAHAQEVAGLAGRCARVLGGRSFVLTTTLRALQLIGAQLREDFAAHGDAIEVLVQGSVPKRQLLAQFLAQPRAVLVGSQSFWEGIDVPGQALQCVLIDKLPFPPPNDPLVQARVRRLEQEGRNAFTDYFVAEAAVSLQQGAGRLIRSETDRGLLVICDPRLNGMDYGKRLRRALPPMVQLGSEAAALAWLGEISHLE
jgi:ATP-dependent DNA helicase DinG